MCLPGAENNELQVDSLNVLYMTSWISVIGTFIEFNVSKFIPLALGKCCSQQY